jgi:hypothetical protein
MAGIGRPSVYTPEIAERICMEMAKGRSLRSICQDEGMPDRSTVKLWIINDREGFSAQYARAQRLRYEEMADETFEIADNGANDWMANNDPDNPGYRYNGEAVARSRLRVDTRKWAISKMLPEYADKLTHAGDASNPVVVRQRIERVIVDPADSDRPRIPPTA